MTFGFCRAKDPAHDNRQSYSCSASALRRPSLPSVFDACIGVVLVSYPLDKLWALTLFNSTRWKERVAELCADRDARILMIQGDRDQFTKHEVSQRCRDRCDLEHV